MSHVIIPNWVSGTTDQFTGIWKLTRGMLAAGWKYRSSADATSTGVKDTSGVAGQQETAFALDKWGVGGGVQLNTTVQSGTGPNITANTDGTATVTFSGSTFTANSVGRFLIIAGCTNAGNNGTFRITVFTSATSIKIFTGGQAVTENTAGATWAEKHGAANGTISTSGTGGAILQRAIFTVGAGTPFVAPTTSPTITRGSVGDRLTIIGGAVSANNGTFIITRVISSTSVEIANSSANATGETNNGSLSWVECSPTAQTYPTSITNTTGTGAWWDAQGPSMMKIPIGTNVPTGIFVRGELVTQTTSGATGTMIGVVTDTSGGLGYLVIEPRINGTGGGPRGWTTGGTDTVSAVAAPVGSGATVTSANITPIEWVTEIVFWKHNNANGHFYVQCVDQSAESTSRYSQIANTSGSVTNTVAPGGVSAAFPTPGSWVCFGTGASGAASTGSNTWFTQTQATSLGNTHIICADCIETAAQGADGSFMANGGFPSVGSGIYSWIGFQRLDDSEDGDVNPYVSVGFPLNGADNYTGSRTAQTSGTSSGLDQWFDQPALSSSASTPYRGWRRRGFSSGDAFQEFAGYTLAIGQTSAMPLNNYGFPDRVANNPTANPIQLREPIWIISTQLSQKMRKGTFRWIFITGNGVSNQAVGYTQNWMQFSTSTQNHYGGLGGPWDGFSIATNG